MLYTVLVPLKAPPPRWRSQVSPLLSLPLHAAVKKPTQEVWIIQVWLLEVCSGAGPGASCSTWMTLSKVNVGLVFRSLSPPGEESGSGPEASNRLWLRVRTRCGFGQDLFSTLWQWIRRRHLHWGSNYKTTTFISLLQVWDDELEQSATHWAEQCQWDHGPEDLLMSIGQNLAVHYGRWASTTHSGYVVTSVSYLPTIFLLNRGAVPSSVSLTSSTPWKHQHSFKCLRSLASEQCYVIYSYFVNIICATQWKSE